MSTHRMVITLVIFSSLVGARQSEAKEKLTFTPKGSEKAQSKSPSCEMAVFQEDSKPDRAFVELGTINFHDEKYRPNAGSLKLETALPKMKELACKAGADAMVDVRVTEVRRLEWAMFNVRGTPVRFVKD